MFINLFNSIHSLYKKKKYMFLLKIRNFGVESNPSFIRLQFHRSDLNRTISGKIPTAIRARCSLQRIYYGLRLSNSRATKKIVARWNRTVFVDAFALYTCLSRVIIARATYGVGLAIWDDDCRSTAALQWHYVNIISTRLQTVCGGRSRQGRSRYCLLVCFFFFISV